MYTIRGAIIEVNKLDTGDWLIGFRRSGIRKQFLFWTTHDIGQRLDYLFRYEQNYAPEYTGLILVEVIADTGQIIDFSI